MTRPRGWQDVELLWLGPDDPDPLDVAADVADLFATHPDTDIDPEDTR